MNKPQQMNVNNVAVIMGLLVLSACGSDSPGGTARTLTGPPNIIYILADDLGYGDLSCYGQKLFSTPNIDQLAAQGMLFTQHYSGSTVCAPSRSALMTGQHTGHTYIRGNKEVRPEGQHPLPDSTVTLAELLQSAGYTTGAFGKWGLGFPGSAGDPAKQGFDTFFGYNCQRLGHHYYPYHLWSNTEKVVLEANAGTAEETYAPNLIHKKTLAFIDDHQEEPFFLFVPSIIPHAELAAPDSIIKAFTGAFPPDEPYQGVDAGKRYRNGPYGSQEHPHAAFAAMIQILDQQVGDIMRKVDELGIADNTIIIFTSDNGPHREGGADPEYFDSNGPLRGFKRDLYEGGVRVPMIVKWPGKVEGGTTSDHISAFWDILPTFAEIAGVEVQPELEVDGISFLPTMLQQDGQQAKHDYLYWEFHERGGRLAVRKGDWKAVRYQVLRNPDAPLELYNLAEDIGETNNVAADHPGVVADMKNILDQAREPSDVFTFDQGTYLDN
jgi:arylsulfatase A